MAKRDIAMTRQHTADHTVETVASYSPNSPDSTSPQQGDRKETDVNLRTKSEELYDGMTSPYAMTADGSAETSGAVREQDQKHNDKLLRNTSEEMYGWQDAPESTTPTGETLS